MNINTKKITEKGKTLAKGGKDIATGVAGWRKIKNPILDNDIVVSVIIPTYNEEKFLPLLLQDLVDQGKEIKFEVIISDKSTDRTREVALEFKDRLDIKVVSPDVGRGVSVQRNYGATKAKSNMLLFLDADTRLFPKALKLLKTRAMDKGYYVGSAWLIPGGKRFIDHLALNIFNLYAVARRPVSPLAPGAFMFVRKEIFDEVGGFDLDVWFAEDADLASKLRRKGYRFAYIPAPVYKFSVRRMDQEGRFKFFMQRVWDGIVYLLPTTIKRKLVIGYNLDGYDTAKDSE